MYFGHIFKCSSILTMVSTETVFRTYRDNFQEKLFFKTDELIWII